MKYIDADKLKAELDEHYRNYQSKYMETRNPYTRGLIDALDLTEQVITSLQQEQDRMRYCIEYINPRYPLLDFEKLNIQHLRIPDEHGAEMALTLMLSFGAKIYALYRGNVKDGKLAEWPTPMIVDTEDWYSVDWLHNILDCDSSL